MSDEVLTWGDSGGGKAKSGMIGYCFGGWVGRRLSCEGIQLGGSSWTKKMVFLRTKNRGMRLFD